MTTLIIGCGYLGRRVAQRLLERGAHVHATTRKPETAEEFVKVGIAPILFDVMTTTPSEIPVIDRILYCVGFDRTSGRDMRDVYVNGLRRTLDVFLTANQRLVYASSTGVYGQDGGVWVTENDATEPRHESGRACLEAEGIAIERGATVVRLAGLYGPGRIIRSDAIVKGEPIVGNPDKLVNLIQIEDAAAATVAALDLGRPGRIYNIVDDRPISRRELYRLTADALNAPPPRFASPNLNASSSKEEDRRISNNRIKAELDVKLVYPDATSGIPASVAV